MDANAPAAPADASAEVAAPVETKDSQAEPQEKAPPKPRTIDDDLEEVLKKHGGYKYKAAGKEKAVTSAADIKRLLSRVDGTESAASEALKAKGEAESIKSTLANVAKLPPRERLAALQKAGVDPKLLREAIEEQILNEDEQAKQQAHLTPRERELEAKLKEREAELARYDQGRKEWEAEQEQNAEAERISVIGKRMGDAAGRALQKAKIAPEHVSHFLPAIADRLDRAERLGLELDEDELAESVLQEQGTLARTYYGGLDIPALSAEFEAMEMDDPDKPGAKTNRLKLLMRHEAAKIRARQNGTPAPVTQRIERPAPRDSGMTVAEKIAAARNFGSGR